jgi:cytochrome oxidase Cu insertion factor (SCO1/SenC/PrrC family)
VTNPSARAAVRALPAILGTATAIAAVAVVTVIVLQRGRASGAGDPSTLSAAPEIAWAAGARPAPSFRLDDEHGAPVSLSALRGRVVLLTFIDPLCRNLCPLEAKELGQAVRLLPAGQRPAVVSVSVNPWGDTRVAFREDASRWRLGPDWTWAIGGLGELERVWRQYEIGVQIETKRLAGVSVHEISHTEATYVIDGRGDERALFVYPFQAADVARAVRTVTTEAT